MKRYDRRPQWKAAVFRGCPGMNDGCKVLLLRLLEDMRANGIVSVPRSTLAADLGIAPARVSERIKLARSLGYLDVVRYAQPKVTAVYSATIPDACRGTESVPLKSKSRGTPARNHSGTDSVPLEQGSEVRMYPTHRVSAQRNVGRMHGFPTTAATEEAEACSVCADFGCPRCTPDESETADAAS